MRNACSGIKHEARTPPKTVLPVPRVTPRMNRGMTGRSLVANANHRFRGTEGMASVSPAPIRKQRHEPSAWHQGCDVELTHREERCISGLYQLTNAFMI